MAQELKAFKLGSVELGEYWAYDAEEVDSVLAEKDEEIARLKDKLQAAEKQAENLINGASSLMFKQYTANDKLNAEIAELQEKRETAENLLINLARKNNHSNYKRCLAMAKSCKDLHDRYQTEYDCDEGFGDGMLRWIRWATKWHNRWFQLADKFKGAK